MERYFLIAVLLGGAWLLTACGAAEPAWSVARGNYSFVRGRYQQATIQYLEGLKEEVHESWIHYNLGNVYNALGEGEAAYEVWSRAEQAKDNQLLFRLYYNRGHLAYQRGEYRRAYDNFREAVRRDPSSREAKINLELSLGKLEAGGSAGTAQGGAGAAGSAGLSPEGTGDDSLSNHERILEYVKKKEGRPWKPGQPEKSKDSVQDW